jgi:hypothetical protein
MSHGIEVSRTDHVLEDANAKQTCTPEEYRWKGGP